MPLAVIGIWLVYIGMWLVDGDTGEAICRCGHPRHRDPKMDKVS